MAEKQKRDRRGDERQRPRVETAIHTADELEEMLLASVRAGMFPAKFFPSWSARLQIEVGKAVREGKTQRPTVPAKPARGASAETQKPERKPEKEKGKDDLVPVQKGIAKFFGIWNQSELPKLSLEKPTFLQSFKDGTLAELISKTIVEKKPADVEPVAYRLAIADFMKSHLGFKASMTPKVVGKEGKKPVYELDESGEKVLVESKFDLVLDLQDGVPRSKTLLSLNDEEYLASQKWFPGVRASLRKLSGQDLVRSQPKPPAGEKLKASAGGGAKAGSTPFVVEEDSDVISNDSTEFDEEKELVTGLINVLHSRYPDRGFDKVKHTDKNVKKYMNLEKVPRKLQSTEIKTFLGYGDEIGAVCLGLYIHSSESIDCRPTLKMLEHLRSGELERIMLTKYGIEIIQDLKKALVGKADPSKKGQSAN